VNAFEENETYKEIAGIFLLNRRDISINGIIEQCKCKDSIGGGCASSTLIITETLDLFDVLQMKRLRSQPKARKLGELWD